MKKNLPGSSSSEQQVGLRPGCQWADRAAHGQMSQPLHCYVGHTAGAAVWDLPLQHTPWPAVNLNLVCPKYTDCPRCLAGLCCKSDVDNGNHRNKQGAGTRTGYTWRLLSAGFNAQLLWCRGRTGSEVTMRMRCASTCDSTPSTQAADLSGGMLLRQSAATVLLLASYSSGVAVSLPVGPSTSALKATGALCMISGCHMLPTTCIAQTDALPRDLRHRVEGDCSEGQCMAA